MQLSTKIMQLLFSSIYLLALFSACSPKEPVSQVSLSNINDFEEVETPNLVLIMVNNLRTDLSCYKHEIVKSPNIDRLAASGMRFKNAFCQVPIPNQSIESLLTSNKGNSLEKNENAISLGAALQKNGYFTIINGYQPQDAEYWDNIFSPETSKLNANGPANASDLGYPNDHIIGKSINDLKQLTEKPFLMVINLPHTNNIPGKYFDLYDVEKLKLPADTTMPEGIPANILTGSSTTPKLSEAQALERVHAYYAGVSYIDALVGLLLDEIESQELKENTVIILCGTNGNHLGEKGLWDIASTFEVSLKVPLIISAPSYPEGHSSDAMVELIDIFPTICELAGKSPPKSIHGRTFVKLLRNPKLPWKGVSTSSLGTSRSIKTQQYRYTHWINDGGETIAQMLFDHADDSTETKNIAESAKNQVVVNELKIKLSGALPN